MNSSRSAAKDKELPQRGSPVGEMCGLMESKLGLGRRLRRLGGYAEELHGMLLELSKENRNLRLDLEEIRSQNASLINSVNESSLENKVLKEREKSSRVHLYKKELRVKKTEVREFQQKLETEIMAKNRLEDEIIFLRKEIERLSRKRGVVEMRMRFKVHVPGKEGMVQSEIQIDGQKFCLQEQEINVNNVFIKPLKSNEMFHMSYRERKLALSVVVIEEVSHGTTPNTRANLKMVEDAIRKEENIQKGIEKIMKISSGKTLVDARTQLEGSQKRLVYLRGELERGRRATDVVYEDYDESERQYEYNNHVFKTKTFPPQTLCEHCNDVLRGVVGQGLECDGCGMAVHRNCYVLTDLSCEMYCAMKQGSRYYIVMRSMEDKERLLRWAKG